MDQRSSFLIGKEVFIKVVDIDTWDLLKDSLKTSNYLPFDTKEICITYLLSGSNLITPNTKVLISKNKYNIADMEKYREKSYSEVYDNLRKDFVSFDNIFQLSVGTAIILSERVDGNFEKFLTSLSMENVEDIENAFIHMSHLYFEFQKKFKMVNIDPKLSNYTWKKLKEPMDMVYDFRDEFNSDLVIRRKVKNLFYLTDLEFAYSPVIKTKDIKGKMSYFNFSEVYDWMEDRQKLIVPRISIIPYYDYNINLYLGIHQKLISNKGNIKELYGLFPRIFVVDILTLVKMILSHHYISNLPPSIARELNRYFTLFTSISKKEESFPYQVDYSMLSPSSFAKQFI